jgi:hypothetical protein
MVGNALVYVSKSLQDVGAVKRREKSELREGILDSSACERLPLSLPMPS